MKKKLKKLMSITVLSVMLFSLLTPPTRTGAAGMSISKKKATLEVDAVLTLKVIGNTDGSAVKWSSSKKSVAKVTSKGKVTAKKEGTATITATVGSNKYKCVVTVVDSNKEDVSTNPDPTPTPTPTPIAAEPQFDLSDFKKTFVFTTNYNNDVVSAYVNFTSIDYEIHDPGWTNKYLTISYSATSENASSIQFSKNVTYWFHYQMLDSEGYIVDSGNLSFPSMGINSKVKGSFSFNIPEEDQSYTINLTVNRMGW